MTTTTDKQPFVADAVFIPDSTVSSDRQGEHADPDACIMLMVKGDNGSADVFTEEAWRNDDEPFCRRESGEFTVVEGGKVELLPDLWTVKMDEREWWLDPELLAACPRIYGVYVFDRRQHVHVCSFEPCYELHFLGSDYIEASELGDDESRRDEIHGKIVQGDAQCEQVTYWGKADIDRMLANEIEPGCLPPDGKHGGYRLDSIVSVTYADAIEEVREAHGGCPL
jgi:hypothetical protein